MSIIEFLKSIEFCYVNHSNVMFIEPYLEGEQVFMHAFSGETHFMYMYSTLFSTLHLIVPFDKFEVEVLRELNVAPT